MKSQEGRHSEKKNNQTVDLEIFVRTRNLSSLLRDMWYLLSWKDVISYGSYDPHSSERLLVWLETVFCLSTIGKKIHCFVRGKVIRPCLLMVWVWRTNRKQPSVQWGYRRSSTPGTKPIDEKKRGRGVKHTYSYQLKEEADVTLYKFSHPSLRPTLFSVPIVLLADSIVELNWYIESCSHCSRDLSGLPDLEYTKPNGLVVSRSIIRKKTLVPQQFAPEKLYF